MRKEFEPAKMVRADQIRQGDIVDLYGDKFADPDEDPGNCYEFENTPVIEIPEAETPNCVLIHFEGVSVGFPPEHELKVVAFDSDYMTMAGAAARFGCEKTAENAALLREIAHEYLKDGLIDQAAFDGYIAEAEAV